MGLLLDHCTLSPYSYGFNNEAYLTRSDKGMQVVYSCAAIR